MRISTHAQVLRVPSVCNLLSMPGELCVRTRRIIAEFLELEQSDICSVRQYEHVQAATAGLYILKLKFHWDQFPRADLLATSPTSS